MCLHAALCSIPFNLLCNMPCSEKVEFRPIEGGGGVVERVCGQNICYHLAAFMIIPAFFFRLKGYMNFVSK